MVQIVSEFFGIIGLSATPPATLAELIPYLLQVLIGVVLVLAVFKLIYRIFDTLMNWRRWK
jgi:hypothetical protein